MPTMAKGTRDTASEGAAGRNVPTARAALLLRRTRESLTARASQLRRRGLGVADRRKPPPKHKRAGGIFGSEQDVGTRKNARQAMIASPRRRPQTTPHVIDYSGTRNSSNLGRGKMALPRPLTKELLKKLFLKALHEHHRKGGRFADSGWSIGQ